MALKREISVNWNQLNSFKDIKILPDHEKAIAGSTNGNFVDIWGFQLNESSKKSLGPSEFENLLEADMNTSSLSVHHKISKLEKHVSDISIVSPENDSLYEAEHSQYIEPSSSLPNPIHQLNQEIKPAASFFKYIPKADGTKALNLDMSNFLKQVIFYRSHDFSYR